jgi:hypothetical protein
MNNQIGTGFFDLYEVVPEELVEPPFRNYFNKEKRTCEHEWTVIGETHYMMTRYLILYCPKCKSKQEESEDNLILRWRARETEGWE